MLVAVTGATGAQGGAVVKALLARGCAVRALVRHEQASEAQRLAVQGASLTIGDFANPESLDALLDGAEAVFSVQPAPGQDADSERSQADALIAAALRKGVRHFVQSTVSHTGNFRTMSGWEEGRWSVNYWESKGDLEAAVHKAGFPCATILRPAFMMENFTEPKARWMFPGLTHGRIESAIRPETRLALIAAADIGTAAAEAICAPERFANREIELAGDWLTLAEIASCLAEVWERPLTAAIAEPDVLVAQGQSPGWIETQRWMNEVGYPARPVEMISLGLVPTKFRDWAKVERNTTIG